MNDPSVSTGIMRRAGPLSLPAGAIRPKPLSKFSKERAQTPAKTEPTRKAVMHTSDLSYRHALNIR